MTRTIPHPDNCQNMDELRVAIDTLDRELVGMLVARADLIDRAITLKSGNGMAARIEWRVEDVVQKVRAEAEARNYDPALAETLWRIIINWSIAREEVVLGAGPQQD